MAEWQNSGNGGMAYGRAYGMAYGMAEMAEWKETWQNECERNRAKGNRTNKIEGI